MLERECGAVFLSEGRLWARVVAVGFIDLTCLDFRIVLGAPARALLFAEGLTIVAFWSDCLSKRRGIYRASTASKAGSKLGAGQDHAHSQ